MDTSSSASFPIWMRSPVLCHDDRIDVQAWLDVRGTRELCEAGQDLGLGCSGDYGLILRLR